MKAWLLRTLGAGVLVVSFVVPAAACPLCLSMRTETTAQKLCVL
jgi:hypothetical protein